jgi:hypothetical protein
VDKFKSRRRAAKIKPIARKRHNFVYLLFAILLAILTGYIFYNFPPDYKFDLSKYNIPLQIPVLPVFLFSLIAFIYSACTFIFIQKIQGALLSIFTLSYLLIRLLGLTHWIFALLFTALFITVELFIIKKK